MAQPEVVDVKLRVPNLPFVVSEELEKDYWQCKFTYPDIDSYNKEVEDFKTLIIARIRSVKVAGAFMFLLLPFYKMTHRPRMKTVFMPYEHMS